MPIDHCRTHLKQHDYARYVLSLTLPSHLRERFWVLSAFNVEISRAAEMSDPMTGIVRLKWWQEALEEYRKHPVVEALHEVKSDCDFAYLNRAIQAREQDTATGFWFESIKDLDGYATATGGFWAALVPASHPQKQWLTSLGQLWALQGMLSSTGYHLSQGRCLLPREIADAHEINPLEMSQGDEAKLLHIIRTLAERIERSLEMVSPPEDAMLKAAASYVKWQVKRLQTKPELALAINAKPSKIKTLWKIVFRS